MKVSLNHIRYYQQRYKWSADPVSDNIEVLLERIGAQLGAVEEVIDLGKKYESIIVAKVVSCVHHPDADRLHVCKIDDGGKARNVERDPDGYVQVVCGAPNVREGLVVVWLPPGSVVPESADKDPFTLETREIRGQKSNGMLASPRELALGDNHDGILEIDEKDAKPGDDFAKLYRLDDYVIDIENKMFTHRPDCFGMLGVAREIAGIQHQAFTSPEWYKAIVPIESQADGALRLTVTNEIPDLVRRFVALPMSDVTVRPSPLWLQINLIRLGVRPINNVVDLTNYYMLLTGQPLHAYDYDKVKELSNGDQALIVVRHPKPGEKLTLLNGKVIEPRNEAIMIATNNQLIGIGGVMGGASTEVDNNTKNIILECANFDMYSIRRTSMTHGLFTDAVTRFTKGQSPLQNLAVLARMVSDFEELVGASVSGPLIDDNHLEAAVTERQSMYPPVKLDAEFINMRLGLKLSADEMKTLLQNVEFKVDVNGDELTVVAPFWRTDIELREDVVEEVGRLYGYDKLPLKLPRRDLTPAAKDLPMTFKSNLRRVLSKAGANEVLTYSFVHGNLLDKVGQKREDAYQLSNALSPELQYYRLSLTPSLLDKVHANIKAGYDRFALFEIGKAHMKPNGDPVQPPTGEVPGEFERLALVFAANAKASQVYVGAPYYQALAFLMSIFKACGIENEVQLEPLDPGRYVGGTKTKIPQYEVSRAASIILGNINLGDIGEYRATVRRSLKLPEFCAGFELDITALAEAASNHQSRYQTLPRFPKVEQDICLKVAADMAYQQLLEFVQAKSDEVKPANSLLTVEPLDIYQRGDDQGHKQITFRLSIASYNRTLTDSEMNKMLDQVAASAKQTLDVERI
jgi:phenylalanyl-tRNA synthetase beta chain